MRARRNLNASPGAAWGSTTRQALRIVRIQPVVLMFALVAIVYGAFSEGIRSPLGSALPNEYRHFPSSQTCRPSSGSAAIRAGSLLVGIVVSEGLMRRLNFANPNSLSRTADHDRAADGVVVPLWIRTRIRHSQPPPTGWRAVCAALQYPVAQTWLNRNIPSRLRATVFSLIGQADALGQIGGGPVVGAVGLRSLRAAMVISGLLLARRSALRQGRHASRRRKPPLET